MGNRRRSERFAQVLIDTADAPAKLVEYRRVSLRYCKPPGTLMGRPDGAFRHYESFQDGSSVAIVMPSSLPREGTAVLKEDS